MLCPKCGADSTMVIEGRLNKRGFRRRRECACGFRFSTIEVGLEEYGQLLQLQRSYGRLEAMAQDYETILEVKKLTDKLREILLK